jgi:peptide/nickel transport system permease protein
LFKYFGIRLLALIPKLFIISIIIFLGLQLVPGDPISRTVPPDKLAEMDEEKVALLREKLGLNDTLFERYGKWIGDIFKGDFGYSLSTHGEINKIIANRLPATLELAAIGLLFATIFGLLFGFISAIKQRTPIDYSLTTLGIIGISVPQFFFGLLAILFFGITLKWLPVGGRMGVGEQAFFDRIQYLVLPSFILGIVYIATLMRYTRGSMLDVMGKDYIKVARSKGLSEVNVNIKHGFRNALIPIMVIIIMRLPYLVAGTVIIETVFNYPGMGSMLVFAISGTDLPIVMITTLLIAVVILLASFLVDVLSALLDPRIRLGSDKEGA